MQINLNDGEWIGDLDQFIADNEFDAIDADDIRETLAGGRGYIGGGGAAGTYTIQPA